MVRIFLAIGVVLVGLLSVSGANSTNLKWLNYSPASYFTDADWEIARKTARQVLDDGRAGETVSWENPKSKNSGSLSPSKAFEVDGMTCRKLNITNNARSLQGKAIYTFCKQEDGRWKALGKLSAKMPKKSEK